MNDDQKIELGRKIKYFRKRAGFSQFKLENEIGASAGSMSRIENGEVNPTKETLHKFRKLLKLSSREFRYLAGDLANQETDLDIKNAVEKVTTYFSKGKVLAYLTDSRLRIQFASKGFQDSFKLSDEFVARHIYGKSLIELLLNPKLNIVQNLDKSKLDETLYHLLVRFYNKCGFMSSDPTYEHTVSIINKYEVTRLMWPKAQKTSFELLNSAEARKVTFKMFGIPIEMHYSVESLAFDNRFDIVEYVPTNRILRLLSKI